MSLGESIRRQMLWHSRHPLLTLAVLGAISALAFIPAGRVRIVTSIDSLMMKDDPEREYYLQTRRIFGSEAMAMVYIEDPNLFSPTKLAAMQELVNELENIHGIISAESLFSVTDIDARDDQLDIHPLIGWAPENHPDAAAIQKRARAHPVIQRLLLSPDADATAIQLRIDMDNGHADDMRALCAEIENVLALHTGTFDRLKQLGRPYVIDQETAYILHDQRVIMPLAICVLVIMLVSILTSFKGAVLPLLTSGISILWTLAFMGIFKLPITELTFMVPALIIVIGSTEDIHLLAEYRSGRKAGMERQPAIERMVARLAIAVIFTAITTFAGFATIIATPIPVLRQFGIVASFGLLVNPLVTISLIPACLALFPDHAGRARSDTSITRIETRVLEILARMRRRPVITILCVSLPCIAAGIYGATCVKADNNIIAFFRSNSPIVQRADRMHEKLSGTESFCIRLDAAEPFAFRNPENLGYALQLQDYLVEAGWIDRSISLTDYLAYIHAALGESNTSLPATTQGIAEYLLLLHRNEIEPYVSPDYQILNIVVRHNLRSSRELMPRIQALREHIAQTCPPNLEAGVTGEMLLVNKAVKAIIAGQLRGILVIAFIAALLLSILFRSVRIGCIALVPNLLPIGIQFGVMALAGIPLNTATSMAAAISIGLAVDDTIHLLMRFYGQDRNLPPALAVERSLRHLIRPITATSLSLTLGFLVMRFSRFVPISDFALLAAMVLLAALVADLVLTPTLLSLKIMHPPYRSETEEPSSEEL